MKKYIALLLSVVFITLALISCGETKPSETTSQNTSVTTSVTTASATSTEVTTPQTTESKVTRPPETTSASTRIDYPVHPAPELNEDDIKNHVKMPLWGDGEQLCEIEDEKVKAKFYKQATIAAYIVDGADSCVVIFPGGGYTTITEAEGANIAKAYNEKGISAFVCYYRCNYYADNTKTTMGYTKEAFLADGQRAVRFARYYAPQFGIDPNKIAVCGFSAGGHLAMIVCQHPAEISYEDEINTVSSVPNACILGYAVTDLTPGMSTQTSQHFFASEEERTDPDMIAKYSYRYAPASMPPTYIWYGEKDTTVNFNVCSIDCAKAFEDAGVTVEIEGFAGIGHAAALATGTAAEVWLEHSVEFIAKAFE